MRADIDLHGFPMKSGLGFSSKVQSDEMAKKNEQICPHFFSINHICAINLATFLMLEKVPHFATDSYQQLPTVSAQPTIQLQESCKDVRKIY